MNIGTGVAVGTSTVDVVLEGGPATIPDTLRALVVDAGTERVKVPHRGGYEHFERGADAEGDGGCAVFRWIMRTKLAE